MRPIDEWRRKFMKRGYVSERVRTLYHNKFENRIAFRVSGSIGAMDLIVVEYVPLFGMYKVWLEQVKSVKGEYFYFDKRAIDEWNRLKKIPIPSYFVINFRFGNRYHWKSLKVRGRCPKSIKWV